MEMDYLYYDWKETIDKGQNSLQELNLLWKDRKLRGLTAKGWTDSRTLPNKNSFDLEVLMATIDIIQSYFHSASGRYKVFHMDRNIHALKSLVEECLFEITNGRLNQISAGTFILAMYHCGYTFKRIKGTTDCLFNVPNVSLKRMEEEISAIRFFKNNPESRMFYHNNQPKKI